MSNSPLKILKDFFAIKKISKKQKTKENEQTQTHCDDQKEMATRSSRQEHSNGEPTASSRTRA